MRILHVVPSYLPATRYGGPIYSVHALCAALVELGHEIHVYTTNVDGPGVSDVPVGVPVDLDGVQVTYFAAGLGRRLYRSPAMGAALRRNIAGFEAVHLHSVFLWPTAAAAAAARKNRVPYVVAPRGMLVADLIRRKSRLLKSAWIFLFERRNLAGAAAVHVTSDIEAEDIGKLGIGMRRVAVIANGIDLPPDIAQADAPSQWDRLPERTQTALHILQEHPDTAVVDVCRLIHHRGVLIPARTVYHLKTIYFTKGALHGKRHDSCQSTQDSAGVQKPVSAAYGR